MPDAVANPALPALSAQLPVALWAAPLPESTIGASHPPTGTPESASMALNDTVTAMIHPRPGRRADADTNGGVLSMPCR